MTEQCKTVAPSNPSLTSPVLIRTSKTTSGGESKGARAWGMPMPQRSSIHSGSPPNPPGPVTPSSGVNTNPPNSLSEVLPEKCKQSPRHLRRRQVNTPGFSETTRPPQTCLRCQQKQPTNNVSVAPSCPSAILATDQ